MAKAKSSIKVRAKEKGGVVTVKCLLSHPMETGLRKNKKTGKLIPAHFIETVTCTANGAEVMSANLSGGVSKNPYLSFKFAGKKGGKINVAWVDNKGNKDEKGGKIK